MFNNLPADIKNIIFKFNREEAIKEKNKKYFKQYVMLQLLLNSNNKTGGEIIKRIMLDKNYNKKLPMISFRNDRPFYYYNKNKLIYNKEKTKYKEVMVELLYFDDLTKEQDDEPYKNILNFTNNFFYLYSFYKHII
jgi:hypothetical protein